MKQFFFAIIIILPNLSCKKSDNNIQTTIEPKYCWKITDPIFIDKGTVCEKTTTEIATLYPDGYYYRSDEALLCWYNPTNGNYSKGLPASLKSKFLTADFNIVACGYCARWYYREKKKYIPTGGITYSPTNFSQLCGDTVQTLFRGREVFLRQTTDSFIVRQFSDNGTNW